MLIQCEDELPRTLCTAMSVTEDVGINTLKSAANPREKLEPAEWVDAYGDYLYRYAQSRLRDANAAEEVVQETFLAGIRFESQFAGDGSQRGWLLGILKRKIIDNVRQRSRSARDSEGDLESDPTGNLFDERGFWNKGAATWSSVPECNLESAELWQIVRSCLRQLPSGQANAFVLSVMEEIDSEQVCNELEISSSNLWVRLHRARVGLSRCVGRKWNLGQAGSDVA